MALCHLRAFLPAVSMVRLEQHLSVSAGRDWAGCPSSVWKEEGGQTWVSQSPLAQRSPYHECCKEAGRRSLDIIFFLLGEKK